MKALVVYDSAHGNTEKIARAIGEAIGMEVPVLRPDAAAESQLQGLDLLVVGSPTYGGQATDPVKAFLERIPDGGLQGVKAATFDTRFTNRLLRLIGFAAGRMANSLKQKGAQVVGSEGFFVLGGEGPLKEGEEQRAASWAREITEAAG